MQPSQVEPTCPGQAGQPKQAWTHRQDRRGAACPTTNTILINLWLSSDAEILLLSTDWAYKSALNVQKLVCNVYAFWLSFHFAHHRRWSGQCTQLLLHSVEKSIWLSTSVDMRPLWTMMIIIPLNCCSLSLSLALLCLPSALLLPLLPPNNSE